MMNTQTRTLYERYRREGYGAASALTIARSYSGLPSLEWDESTRSNDLARATVERDGFTVRIRVRQDDVPSDVLFTDDKPDEMPNLYANPGEWADEAVEGYYGRERLRWGRFYGWVTPDDAFAFSEVLATYQGRGYAKQPAFEAAVEDVRRWVQWVTSDEYFSVFVTAEAYREGIDLGTDSIGGIEVGSPWGVSDLVSEVEEIVTHDYTIIENAIAEAREVLEKLCKGRN